MASSIILDSNVGNTLRSLLTQPSNNPNALMTMNKVNPYLRPNNNGAENFMLKSLFEKLEKAQSLTIDLMKSVNNGVNSLNDKFQKMIEGNKEQFDEEQKERAAEKNDRKRKNLDDDKKDFLKSIAEAIEEKTDRFKKSKIGNMFYGESSIANWLGGVGAGLTAIITPIIAAAIPVILTALAGVSLVQFLRGAFDASAISGEKDLTGIGGAFKVIKAGLAKTFSTFTFGAISDQEMYKMQDELIDKVKPYLWQAVDFLVDVGVQLFDMIYDALEGMIGPKFTEKAKPFKDKIHGYKVMYDIWKQGPRDMDISNSISSYIKSFLPANTDNDIVDLKQTFDMVEKVVDETAPYLSWLDSLMNVKKQIGSVLEMAGTPGYALPISFHPQLKSRVVPQDEAAVSTLGATAKTQAKELGQTKSTGYCARGVDELLVKSGIIQNRMWGNADTLTDRIAKNKNFEEASNYTRSDLLNLPPGYIISYGKQSADHPGHIAVTLGGGKEVSDHVGTTSHSLGKKGIDGKPVSFRVFKPIKRGLVNRDGVAPSLDSLSPEQQSSISKTFENLRNNPNLLDSIDTQSYENSKATDLIQKTKPVEKIAYSEDSKSQSAAPVIINNNTNNNISPSMDTSLFDSPLMYLMQVVKERWRY